MALKFPGLKKRDLHSTDKDPAVGTPNLGHPLLRNYWPRSLKPYSPEPTSNAIPSFSIVAPVMPGTPAT